ncbi:MAG: aminopeptidase P N-terminal domain-containing protein [Thiomicrorhabdus sp.]|jgi:Xaa-Pro aminopeptidase|nr:aminopeptidase P N-terminal domain-containing protein [Thiomicrorhabdus sp.]
MFKRNEFHQFNRQKLLASLPENSAVLVSSGAEKVRNRDVEYPFRAESDFFYLTGLIEPDCVLVLLKKESLVTHLFLRPKDPEQETWQGRRLGLESACEALSIDQAWSVDELDEGVLELLENIESVYFSFSQISEWLDPVSDWIGRLKQKVRQGISAPNKMCDLDDILHEQRLFKSAEEISRMRQAAQISVKGHLAAMATVLPGKFEFQVQAELEAAFVREGSPRVAFSSIVAGGHNACILHYTENRDEIKNGDLVLVDAGAEWQGYAGDITTTFPANGKFSSSQAILYSLVLKAQQAAISVIQPGVAFNVVHETSVKVLTQGLIDLGILKGELKTLIKNESYKRFFMHGTGHWLGMDVHDVGAYKHNQAWREFKPGMVVTVEPGLYISAEHSDMDSQWHNIGIRIEDDILVTDKGHEVLTVGLPRTVAEIEAQMSVFSALR